MRVLTCLTTEHDPLLVGLAAAICVFGAYITMRLFMRSREGRAGAVSAWIFLGAVAAGSTIWCTHFVAMLAYRPGVEVSYEPVLTGLSLVVAILASSLSLLVARLGAGWAPKLGGGLFGLGVAAMHYTGMSAFGAEGVVSWDAAHVGASIVLAAGLGGLAFHYAARRPGAKGVLIGAGLLVLAIVALHFTAMAAMTITPFQPSALTSAHAYNALAFAVAGVGVLVLGTGLASYVLDRQGTERTRASLRQLAESTVDGVVIVQGGRVVEVNAAFEKLIAVSRDELIGRGFETLGLAAVAERELVHTTLTNAAGLQIPIELFSRSEAEASGMSDLLIYSVRDVRQRLAQERRMAHLARNDSLTGLPNRTSFLEHLDRALKDASDERKLALLAIDLDRFKEVNDLHGHAAGDHVLKALSERMRLLRRNDEFIARLGGDEFVATVTVSSRADALDLASRLETELGAPIPYEHGELGCGASIGIALYPDDGASTTALMNNADLAMYRAKAALTQSVCFYEEEMDEVVRARRKVVIELRDALARNQFELHYQLQASARTRKIVAYEALLRWRHPERGYIAPGDFISLAEETGLIGPIGEWVLRRACADAASWPQAHRLAVNLSAVQLCNIDLPRLVHEVLIETGLAPSRLELEITETALIQDPVRTTHILRQLKAIGVSIAMDDFGVGYSSLSTLRAFPFDKIKLDKSFMHEIDMSPQARAIIRAVLTIGSSLGIPVLAEGVETEEQLAFLQQENCDEVQGFLLGRPARAVTTEEIAQARPAAEAKQEIA